MKYYHGSRYKFSILKENSWVTPYPNDAMIFAIPWSSNELENPEIREDGRPPQKLFFKSHIPNDHPIYLYEILENKIKHAPTNTGVYYNWNYKTTSPVKVKLIKVESSWQNKYLGKAMDKNIKSKERIIRDKKFIKTNKTFIDLCEEYDQDPSIIDLIPICFKDLDVSAKTDHGIIYLNSKLLKETEEKDYSYLIHELTHFFQQCFNGKPTKVVKDEDYLDNKEEIEGFQNQIKFLAEELGVNKAEDYIDNLLDHHEVDDKIKDKKKEVLLDKVDD